MPSRNCEAAHASLGRTASHLTREAAGADGRQRVVRLTDRGLRFAAAAKSAVLAIEDDLTTILGERRMAALTADLATIPAGLAALEAAR